MSFTLEKGKWYGMTMYPGYNATAYHSPIRIDAIHPGGFGLRRLDIDFYNAGYAPGMQDFSYSLDILKREEGYLLAAIRKNDRAIAIMPFNLEWAHVHMGQSLAPFMEIFNETGCVACAMNKVISQIS